MNMSVNIGSIKLKNPIIAASGTFGFGHEFSDYLDLNILGGISGKGITKEPRTGNAPPRVAETPSGMLNSVGLQNPGIEAYIREEIPFIRSFDIANIANVAGNTIEEYCWMAERLSCEDIDAIELNVSCPNVKTGCLAFGSDAAELRELLKNVRKKCGKTLIIKLSPNVTDIGLMARICEDEGADAVSLINTILGMAIDADTKTPILANNFGGLSGPCVKPVALRMVCQVYNTVRIPIIGMGGICGYRDAVEFMMAGATACMVGTANFRHPGIIADIVKGLEQYMISENIEDINSLIGSLKLNRETQ